MSQSDVTQLARKITEIQKRINRSYIRSRQTKSKADVVQLVYLDGYFAGLCAAMDILSSSHHNPFPSQSAEQLYERLFEQCKEP
jgi:hypothetical protein